MRRAYLTRQARCDVLEIEEYIAKDNPIAVAKFVDRLEERWLSLGSSSNVGRKRPDLMQDLRSVSEGEYFIFYRVLDNSIEIMRVVHTARQLEKLFSSRK